MRSSFSSALISAAVLILFAAAPKPAYAQDDLSSLSIQELMNLEVASSSKQPVPASKAAGNVEVITRDDIRRYGYRTVSEALRRIVGFNVYSLQYDFAFVRGFSVPGDINTRILMMVDGHRVNDNNYLQGFIGEEFPADIENVDRIEVSKGPGSAVFGTNAMLAVVNVVTRKGGQMGGQSASYDYGSNSRQKWFAASGEKIDDFEYSLTASSLNSDGENSISFPPKNGQFTRVNGVDQESGYRLASSMKYKDLSLNIAYGVRQTQVPYGFFGTAGFDGGNTYSDNFTRVDLNYDTLISAADNSRFAFRFYFDRNGFDGNYVYGSDEDPFFRLVNSDRAVSRLYGFEARYSREIVKNLSMIVGVEAQDNYSLFIQNFDRSRVASMEGDVSSSIIDASEPYKLYSPYAELNYQLAEGLTLVGGVRGDIYSSMSDAAAPRGALIFAPNSDSTFKLMYGEGFRSSGNAERNYADGFSTSANKDLNPERIRTTEGSWEQRIGQDLEARVNIFYYSFADLIYQGTNSDGLATFLNSDSDATSKGVELTGNYRVAGGVTAYAGMTFFETRKDGQRLVASPRALANAGVSVPVWENKIFLSPEIRYVGSAPGFTPDADIDSYIAANFAALIRPFGDDLELTLGAYNLFNTEYFIPAGFPAYDSIPQQSATYRAQLLYRFN